jgi:hypothetical protein
VAVSPDLAHTVPGRFSHVHVLSACLLFFPSLNSGRAPISKNGSRFSPTRTGPRAQHSALFSLCVHYLAKCERLKSCRTSNLKHLTSSMMKSLRLTLSPLLSIMIKLSLARRSIIPPSVPFTTAHGAVSKVYGRGVSFCLCWLAKSSRYALRARTSPRRSSQPGTGSCPQPRPSSCTKPFFLLCTNSHRCSPDTSPFSSFIRRTRSTSVCLASFDKEVFLRYACRWF